MEDKERKPLPGDADYKGGIFHTTVRVNGKVKDVRVEKDAYGNIIYMSETDKIFGIF